MKSILSLVTALLLSTALAHTEVTAMTPAENATVHAPKTVALTLSEPVNLRFCTFRVMAIPTGKTAEQASVLALAAKNGAALLVNLPARSTGMAAQVTIPLKATLAPGQYVVAWKLLSDDGHPVSGFSTFSVK
ncbi:copper resistance protein CopC [Deinococcus sp. KSM4-11]|uniref:copper resistance CopC family protein n=1 Tax=Deinococcus sp. KSM4-11 TaxID=2568654 RepID=UPI0010A5531C|nr:copper resistance CopC family protein [Deinococcus sp. KSM4-11]THF87252.1 copper resistance protein CopC [Deinococcus sp. KSM4-11]